MDILQRALVVSALVKDREPLEQERTTLQQMLDEVMAGISKVDRRLAELDTRLGELMGAAHVATAITTVRPSDAVTAVPVTTTKVGPQAAAQPQQDTAAYTDQQPRRMVAPSVREFLESTETPQSVREISMGTGIAVSALKSVLYSMLYRFQIVRDEHDKYVVGNVVTAYPGISRKILDAVGGSPLGMAFIDIHRAVNKGEVHAKLVADVIERMVENKELAVVGRGVWTRGRRQVK